MISSSRQPKIQKDSGFVLLSSLVCNQIWLKPLMVDRYFSNITKLKKKTFVLDCFLWQVFTTLIKHIRLSFKIWTWPQNRPTLGSTQKSFFDNSVSILALDAFPPLWNILTDVYVHFSLYHEDSSYCLTFFLLALIIPFCLICQTCLRKGLKNIQRYWATLPMIDL